MNVGFGYEASTNGAGAEHGAEHGKAAKPPLSLDLARTRPELLIGAAFAGGVIAALLLRRLGR